jgi:hypothetical protein
MQHAESRIKELDEGYNRKLDAHNWLQKEYDREFDDMTSRLLTLAESRRNEVNILNNNELEISRKAKVLACYEGIINYLNSEAKGGRRTEFDFGLFGTSLHWQISKPSASF